MRSRFVLLASAVGVGVVLTAALTVVAYWASLAGMESLARVAFWPNTLLQSLAPCHNIGMGEERWCEGTPVNVLAYVLSFPLSVAVYSALAYGIVRSRVAHAA